MSLEDEVELLRNIPLFAKLEPSKLKLLAFTAERITYEADQILFSQGDVGDAAYIIVDGAANVIVETPDGELELAELGRNDFVGEIAILCDVPRTATVRASTRTVALRITKDMFFRLVGEFPEMSVEIMRELAARLEHTTHQLREALAKNS